MEEQLSTEHALDRLAGGQAEAIVLTGDFDLELFRRVYAVCRPKPSGVALVNSTDELAREVARSVPHLRVGVPTPPARGLIAVVLEDVWLTFGRETTSTRRERADFTRLHDWLVPYDGASLASSVARATPARRNVLMWLAAHTEGQPAPRPNPAAVQFGFLDGLPKIRNFCFRLAPFALALGLVPRLNPVFYLGLAHLVVGVAAQLYLLALRRRYGVGLA